MSTLGGNHLTLGPKVVKLLKDKGLDDVLVLMGGVIPEDDIPLLKEAGIARYLVEKVRLTLSHHILKNMLVLIKFRNVYDVRL